MKKLLLLGGNELHKGFSEWKCRSQVDSIIVVDWNEKPSYIGDLHIKEDIKNVDKETDAAGSVGGYQTYRTGQCLSVFVWNGIRI